MMWLVQVVYVVGATRFELVTSCSQSMYVTGRWLSGPDRPYEGSIDSSEPTRGHYRLLTKEGHL